MKPKFIAIAAVTLDGKIAKDSSHPSDWTSPEDKKFMRALLDKCDVVIVGNNTYKTAGKFLSKRNCIVFTRQIKTDVSLGKTEQGGGALLYCDPKKIDIKKLIKKLGYKTVAVLGGAQIYTYCLENNLLDKIYLTIEPVVFGSGIDLFASKMFLDKRFKLLSAKTLNTAGSLLLRYKTLKR